MKNKIILTESQILMVKNRIINEAEGNRYKRKVNISISTNYEQKYKGMEIGDVRPSLYSEIELNYLIDQEQRSWGIKGITLYSISGPSEIEAEIEFYPNDSDEPTTETIVIPLDWENSLFTNEKSGEGVITIGDELDISLYISESGEFSVEMSLDVYTL